MKKATTATKNKKRAPTPRTARNDNDLCAMRRDNVQYGDFWMITDGYRITLAEQMSGEMPTQKITVPRDVFDAFVDWYMTGVWIKPKAKKRAA